MCCTATTRGRGSSNGPKYCSSIVKKFGLIGGIGPESTAKYYQLLIQEFRERLGTDDYPEFTIRSINMTQMLSYVFGDDMEGLTQFLLAHVRELERSGIEVAALASNTPHIVFDRLKEQSSVELISIVEATCQEIQNKGHKAVGLFGTKSTMTAGFYSEVASSYGIAVKLPDEGEMDFIHQKYFEELVFNNINTDTKARLVEIALGLKESEGIEGLILGGTELSLILNQSDFDELTIYDTTRIHVGSIVTRMLED